MNTKLIKCWHLKENHLTSKDICNVFVRKKNKIMYDKTQNINCINGLDNYVKNILVIFYFQKSQDSLLLL